jgi:hypothetical protein
VEDSVVARAEGVPLVYWNQGYRKLDVENG